MAAHAPSTPERTRSPAVTTPLAARSDPLDFCRGLALALPISLLLWIAIIRVAWWLWRG